MVYILLAMIAVLMGVLVWTLLRNPANQELIRQNRELVKTQQILLNRLQAGDLKTFQVLQTSLNPTNEDYVAQDDESEAKRVQDLNGVGEAIYLTDEDIRMGTMDGFGIGIGDWDGNNK